MATPELFLKALGDLQGASVGVRLDCALVEHGDSHLRIGWLRTELVVGVTHALANSVDTDEGTRRQEVLAL